VSVTAQPRLGVHRLPLGPAPSSSSSLGWFTGNARRLLRFAGALRQAIVTDGPPSLILVQSPPLTPVVDVCAAMARLHGAALVVDWHNLEVGMVALRLGDQHPLVAAVSLHEARWVATAAAAHLAVTDALGAALRRHGRERVVVFPDAPERFIPTPVDRAALRARHGLNAGPLLVMSSSFSLDDDLDLLVAGLAAMGRPVSLLLTGDGPRRDETCRRIAALPHVALQHRFFDADDYLEALSSADGGVSVHRSASGLDFPMKLTDYAAAHLPAAALDDGPVLRDGLRPGDRTFVDATTCAAAMGALLDGASPRLVPEGPTWLEGWETTVWPVLVPLLRRRV
jgi:hypothetical protein